MDLLVSPDETFEKFLIFPVSDLLLFEYSEEKNGKVYVMLPGDRHSQSVISEEHGRSAA